MAIAALVLFITGTLWINYEVKVKIQGGHNGGSVPEMGHVKLGGPSLDFSTLDLSNRPVSLADYRGKRWFCWIFGATWCGPCRMEMVDLQALLDKFKDQGFEILSLNEGESAEAVQPFITRKKYNFHVLLDRVNAVGDKYGVEGIPTLVLIDKSGVIQWLQVGYSEDSKGLERKIASLIQK